MTMPGGLVIKCNLTSSDRLAHFSTQWTNYWHGKRVGWLTDLQLVGRNGAGWGRVGVHRAVIVPLCPLIAVVEQDVMREDPVIILPQFPVELLEAFASLIYTGSTSITAHVNVVSMLELMNIVGLKMPVDRLYVIRKEPSDVEIICYKNPSSLEISMVNSATPHRHAAPAPSARRNSLEIIRTLKNGNILDHGVSKIVQTQTSSKQKECWPITSRQTRAEMMREIVGKYVGYGQASHEDDTSWMEHRNASDRFDTVPIDIKFECEDAVEYLYDVAEAKSTKKRKWNRKSETLQKLSNSCYYCDFKCRFVKDLQEHCDLFHSEKEFSCQKCNFKTSGIAYMKYHMRKKHIKAGEFNCDICDLKVNSKRKLMTHKARCCKVFGSKRRKKNVKSKDYQEISFHTNSDDQSSKEKVVNKDDLEASLELNGLKAVNKKNEQIENEHMLEELNDDCEVTLQKNFGEETNDGNNDESSEIKKSNVERLNKNCIDPTVSCEKDTFVQTDDAVSGIVENIECTLKEIPLIDQKKTERSQVNVENVAMMCSPTSNSTNKDYHKEAFKIASLKEVFKTSNDVIGFQCNASNCSKVSRVYKTRLATSALNMLEDHHAKTHLDVKEKFSYTILYKEDTILSQTAKQQDVEETDPLSILKKLKKSHIKPTTGFQGESVSEKIPPLEVEKAVKKNV